MSKHETQVAQVTTFLRGDGSISMRLDRFREWMGIDRMSSRTEMIAALECNAELCNDVQARIVELEAELATTREAVDGQHAVGFRDAAVKYGTQLTKTRADAVAACLELKLRIIAEPPQMWPDDESWRDQHARCVQAAGEFEGEG